MRTHAPTWRTAAFPTSFALACVVLTIFLVHAFGGSLPFAPQGYRFEVSVPDASNVVVGSDADIAGVVVGHIVAINRQENRAILTVELNTPYAPLHSGARVTIGLKSALGEGYLAIAPGSPKAPPLRDGGMLPVSHVQPPVTLSQFLSTFDPQTRARFRNLFTGLAGAFSGRAQQLSDSLANSATVSANLQGILSTLDQQRPQLEQLFAASGHVFSAMGTQAGIVQGAIENGNRLLSATADRNRALTATIETLPGFLGQLRTTADEITTVSPDLNRAVNSLLPAAPYFVPALQASMQALPTVRTVLAELPPVLRAGDRGLPTVSGTVSAARAGFKGFYPAARNLIPLIQLLAQNRDAIITLAPASDSESGASVAPDGTVVSNAMAAPILSNELIAGWVKKLPTNRPNPYVDAQSLTDIERIGYPRSYDCRHIHNPEYLPPIFGVPPCTVQGPIDFNGVLSDFPHLTLAPP